MDEHSQALLSATLKQFDILEENVTCTSGLHFDYDIEELRE